MRKNNKRRRYILKDVQKLVTTTDAKNESNVGVWIFWLKRKSAEDYSKMGENHVNLEILILTLYFHFI